MRPTFPKLLLLATLAATAAGAEPFDHYDPAALVARARQAMGEGALRDACVLLSRAGQLAPHDARVSVAWGEWEAAMNGMPPPAPAPLPVPAAAAPAPARAVEVAPEPPAPWPAR